MQGRPITAPRPAEPEPAHGTLCHLRLHVLFTLPLSALISSDAQASHALPFPCPPLASLHRSNNSMDSLSPPSSSVPGAYPYHLPPPRNAQGQSLPRHYYFHRFPGRTPHLLRRRGALHKRVHHEGAFVFLFKAPATGTKSTDTCSISLRPGQCKPFVSYLFYFYLLYNTPTTSNDPTP